MFPALWIDRVKWDLQRERLSSRSNYPPWRRPVLSWIKSLPLLLIWTDCWRRQSFKGSYKFSFKNLTFFLKQSLHWYWRAVCSSRGAMLDTESRSNRAQSRRKLVRRTLSGCNGRSDALQATGSHCWRTWCKNSHCRWKGTYKIDSSSQAVLCYDWIYWGWSNRWNLDRS